MLVYMRQEKPTDETVNISLSANISDAVKDNTVKKQCNSRALTKQGIEARRQYGSVVTENDFDTTAIDTIAAFLSNSPPAHISRELLRIALLDYLIT